MSIEPDVRIRKAIFDDNEDHIEYTLTIKQGKGLIRRERTIFLDEYDYTRLTLMTIGRRLYKDRYTLPDVKFETVIDVFHRGFSGLIVAEVEFPHEFSAERFVPFEWMGREVTNDEKFKNKNLAIMGLSELVE